MIQVTLGQRVKVVSRQPRADGLTDRQEVIGRVTYVDEFRAEFRVTERLAAENVLLPLTGGGFSRHLAPATFARLGYTLLG